MRDLSKYKGVFPAFYACYEDNGDMSADRTARFAEYLLKKGVKGLYVGGSSGECIYLSVEERKRTLEAVMDAVGGKMTIIAHVACNNTKDSMELAAHAKSVGADAIAAIPPIYFHLPEASIAKYWNDISSAAPDTDFFIYNIPQLAGVTLTENLFREMRKNPNVIGVKNSSMPVQDIQIFKMIGGDDCIIFNGPDEQFISGRIIGADGGIGGTYAVMPELFLKADELIKNGKFDTARSVQHAINDVIYSMCACKCNMYAAAKQILREQGIDIGGVRAPLEEITPEGIPIAHDVKTKIDRAIEAFCL